MVKNLYGAVYRRARENEHRVHGWGPRVSKLAMGLLVLCFLMPVVRSAFLGFLDQPQAYRLERLEGLALRVTLVMVSIVAIEIYGVLIRGDRRPVVELLPVDPHAVVGFELALFLKEEWWIAAFFAGLLLPVGVQWSWAAWGLLAFLIGSAWFLSVTASAMVFLFAVEVAQSERWSGLLDALRGSNPRPQAAFIYAPGVVLAVAGGLLSISVSAVPYVLRGQPIAFVLMLLPLMVAVACALPLAGLARSHWFAASSVLAEIEARYAPLMSTEDGRRVYLDWLVPYLPLNLRPFALRDLRHGWRARRLWVTGAWLFGLGGAALAWEVSQPSLLSGWLFVLCGIWCCAMVGLVLERAEPVLLIRNLLSQSTAPRLAARTVVMMLWLQGCIAPLCLVLLFRHDWATGLSFLLASEVMAAVACGWSLVCSRLRAQGALLYAPTAAGTVGLMAVWLTT